MPQALRQQQLAVVRQIKPPFAIIAGGRPDQAAQLQAEGIITYLHVPSCQLLQLFLEQGARHFIFEGSECGGHVGPLSSFVLWESMSSVLLQQVPSGQTPPVRVLFAGGIHDACSAAMVSALAAPLVKHGIQVGVLMGSAYLFTQEAITCGAIVPGFQQIALQCDRTINLETGPGHASRCAVTPFTQAFYATRQQLLSSGQRPEDVARILEDLSLGRLRIAAKGLRRAAEQLHPVDDQTQQAEGMYMIGQVATLRHQVCTLAALHQAVSVGSQHFLEERLPATPAPPPATDPVDIAVIGIGTLLPGAQTPDQYWQNLLERVSAIQEIPPHRWDWRLYYSPDRQARDKVYSKWGGFLEAIPFDPVAFGIPPKSLPSIEPAQLLALETVRRALEDAGYGPGSAFDREHTAVILGASGGIADLGQQYATRAELPRWVKHLDEQVWEQLPEWTEESFPGILLNVIAGRVANRFNFGGANFTVDAACASSLAAVDVAVAELVSGRCALAIAGGVDTLQSAFAYFCFSKTQALSPQGIARSFDQAADGIVISEGVAMVVLKRLADAERDGDRIYGVIKAVASSSDGKGLSMTAPASRGQQRALGRAYARAGVSPATLGLYEAHGTGTVAGDRAELETIRTLMQAAQASAASCALGSVKTLIGHTKSTAGVAALIKAVLALYHRVLPPHTQVQRPLPGLQGESPLYLVAEAQPWCHAQPHPRRAGVSAFGFGGTNFHAVLEEYPAALSPAPCGTTAWPCELLLFAAADRAQLRAQVASLQADLQAGAAPALADLAYTLIQPFLAAAPPGIALALVVRDREQLQQTLAAVLQRLDQESAPPLLAFVHLHPAILQDQPVAGPTALGKVAFLFPGQGAQYPDMAREVALYWPEMRQAIEAADRQLGDRLPTPLARAVYPPAAFDVDAQAAVRATLTDTRVAQPAIGAISAGYLAIAQALGLEADMMAGHSYGEYTALYASGVLNQADFLHLSAVRGQVMATALEEATGTMAAVMATRSQVLQYLAEEPDVVLANHNAPQQAVISGPEAAIARLLERLQADHIDAQQLPVAGAFHSPLVHSAQAALATAIEAVAMAPPRQPVYSNMTAQPYPTETAALRSQLAGHLVSQVEFVSQIEAMYADGARYFIEIGPKRILTKLVQQILAEQSPVAVSLESRDGLAGLLQTLGALGIRGLRLNWARLFQGRPVQRLALDRLFEHCPPPPSPTSWWVEGGRVRPQVPSVTQGGQLPPLQSQVQPSLSAAAVPLTATPSAIAAPASSALVRVSGGASRPMTSSSSMPPSMPPSPPSGAHPALAAYQTYQETMRQFLALQESVMGQFLQTLGPDQGSPVVREAGPWPPASPGNGQHAAGNGQPSPPAVHSEPRAIAPTPPPAPAPDPLPVAPTMTPETALERDSLITLLVTLVSDRTGYPPDMLGLDQDMEADLGIDSIKRVEIFGALQKALPPTLGATVQAQLEHFTQVKTLNGLVDALLQAAATPASAESAESVAEAPRLGKSEGAVPADLPRYVMQPQPQAAPAASLPLTGVILMTPDQAGIAPQVAGQLEQAGAVVGMLSTPALAQPLQLRQEVDRYREHLGPIAGIVHLAGLSAGPCPATLAAWRQATQHQVKSLFHLLQACGDDLQQQQGRVVAVTRLGGYWGRQGDCGPGLPAAGGSSGLLKTLMLEWPQVHAAVVDVDGDADGPAIAAHLLAELQAGLPQPEVGYPQGQRLIFTPVAQPLATTASSPTPQPAADWVVLALGGARGITAEALRALLVPGMTLVLVGRSPLPPAEAQETQEITDLAQLRQHLIQQARAQGQSPSPAQIEQQLQQMQRDRDRRAHLAAYRQAGAEVDYRALDVRDEAAMQALLQEIYQRYGRLDAVLQGAGMIADKRLVDKSEADFERVFDTKADSTFLLARHLQPATLKLMILFASVAGRTGNQGQCDYASANEVVNRWAWWMRHQWPHTRVVSINWGPWSGTGMASEAVNRQFRAQGVIPIDPAAGRRYLEAEICSGERSQVEVIVGLFAGAPEAVAPPAPDPSTLPTLSTAGPLLTQLPQIHPNGLVTLEQTFSLSSDPYLQDHQLDQRPVLAAAAQEWLAEFVQAAWPDWVVCEVRQLRVLGGIVINHPEGVPVRLVARAATHASADTLMVSAEIQDPLKGRAYYRATLVLRSQLPVASAIDWPDLATGHPLEVATAYRQYCFHGPQFQLIDQIIRISDRGVDARVRPSHPAQWLQRPDEQRPWLFDPGLIDASLQMGLIFARTQGNTSALPGCFGRVVRHQLQPPSPPLTVKLRVKTFDTVLIYDALFIDAQQRLYLQLTDMEGSCSQALNRLTLAQ